MNTNDVILYYTLWKKTEVPSHELLAEGLFAYLSERDGIALPAHPGITVVSGNAHGKPVIPEFPEVHFSISHSGAYWACAFSGEEVGLDLQVTDHRNWDRLPARFFHPDECRWLEGRGSDDFFLLWAYKESYIKFTGNGLSEGLRSFSAVSESNAAGALQLTGCTGVIQQEVPFPEEQYKMVLTTGRASSYALRPLAPLLTA